MGRSLKFEDMINVDFHVQDALIHNIPAETIWHTILNHEAIHSPFSYKDDNVASDKENRGNNSKK